MQPGTATFLQVAVGMPVVDTAGTQVGVVAAVQPPGTDVRPDTIAGIAEHLMATGYLLVDGTGYLSNDVYVAGNQLDRVTTDAPGVVELLAHADELHRTAS